MKKDFSYTRFVQLGQQIESTPAIEWDELSEPLSMEPEVLDLYDTGYRRGFSTGWRSLDPFFTVRHGEFTVITGIPGHGKSTWLDNVMVNLARAQNWRWAVFSAENFPVSRHLAGLSEIYLGKPFQPGPTPRMSKRDLSEALEWLNSRFVFIRPKEDRYSLDRIVQAAIQAENIDALVIDPWNELDHSRPKDQREDEFISVSLTKLRWFARTANIHVFVVAHPAKYYRIPNQPKPVITLNDVKGASEWYAKADNGLSVWRDEQDETNMSDVHVQKIRFREVGRAGNAVRLQYDRVTGRFIDPMYPVNYHEAVEKAERPFALREPGEEG